MFIRIGEACECGQYDGYFGSRVDISGGGGKCGLRCQGDLSEPLLVRDLNNKFISHNRQIQFNPFPAAEMYGGVIVLDRSSRSDMDAESARATERDGEPRMAFQV